jgi:hypothetical protein
MIPVKGLGELGGWSIPEAVGSDQLVLQEKGRKDLHQHDLHITTSHTRSVGLVADLGF